MRDNDGFGVVGDVLDGSVGVGPTSSVSVLLSAAVSVLVSAQAIIR